MRSNARNPVVAIVTLLGTLVLGRPVLAADYGVDFGVETNGGKDAGSLTCLVGPACTAKMESLGLIITFLVFRSEPERVRVDLYSNSDPSCCYFGGGGGARSIRVDPRQPLLRMSFYRGIEARGALLIENERVGTLYLRFHSR